MTKKREGERGGERDREAAERYIYINIYICIERMRGEN